jgi:hypothetical protein
MWLLIDSNGKNAVTRWPLWCRVFGYKFGYRRQFALISASYAKLLQVGMGLAGSLITLEYFYLS